MDGILGHLHSQQLECGTDQLQSALCFVERLKDFERIRAGDIVLITLNALRKYQKQIKRWIRLHNQKIQLIFDESDEISNTNGLTTKACLDCFRKCRCKLLTTGTSTRNNIVEFAPQLELLYNNSVNMLSWCPEIYRRNSRSHTLHAEENPYFGCPIPAYKRATPCFRPRIFRRKSRSLAQRNGRRIFTMLPRSVRFWEKQ